MKKTLLVMSLSLLTALPALAADNPWVGTWKANTAKSHLTGETFTYSKTPDGMMRYDDGSPEPSNFRIDGKEYPVAENRTTVWTATAPNTWDSVGRYKGAVTFKAHRTLSADGKTYSIHSTNYLPDGSTSHFDFIYTRVTGTSGLEGKWRSTKVVYTDDLLIISAKDSDTLRWEIPAYKQTVEGKLDGSDLPMIGAFASSMTIAYKQTSGSTLSYVVKEKGRPVYYGTDTLAPDGKSMTDTSWAAGKDDEKTSSFYEKQ